MDKIKVGYRNLLVHQKADELAFKIYQTSNDFPKYELLGITSQLRRAAISVPANIAEGYTRTSNQEKIRFLNIAQGSLIETEYFLEFAYRLGYLENKNFSELQSLKELTGKLLNGFIKAFKTNNRSLISDHR